MASRHLWWAKTTNVMVEAHSRLGNFGHAEGRCCDLDKEWQNKLKRRQAGCMEFLSLTLDGGVPLWGTAVRVGLAKWASEHVWVTESSLWSSWTKWISGVYCGSRSAIERMVTCSAGEDQLLCVLEDTSQFIFRIILCRHYGFSQDKDEQTGQWA